MKTIAILSQKGGAGKSTIAMSLAAALQAHGKDTMIIDCDPQGSLAHWGRRRVNGGQPLPVVVSASEKTVERQISIAERSGGEYVIIDSPGKADPGVLKYARLADLVVIPVRANIFDMDAATITMSLFKTVRTPHLAVVNALRPNSRLIFSEFKEHMENAHDATVAPFYIAQRAAYADCLVKGASPVEHENDKRGKCTREIAALHNLVVSMTESEVAA